ncbi:hypothetical protein PMI35_01277 [Pseudomonas sp. GM78]|uniref:hypothetical protein n=1 Tax=Pseudomonas sp. GM78 TaxID=1144337 RepID=UPI00026F85FC|nr:hypothetical protein [Pseudomonas sp. GM78]EJN31788.1 hypothetical protein PMI35_01277 [Pseudomonas sp. GM78]
MSNSYSFWKLPVGKFETYKEALAERCEAAGIPLKDLDYSGRYEGHTGLSISLKCGRELRELEIFDHNKLPQILSIPFEDYNFLSGLEAICSYEKGLVEIMVIEAGAASAATFIEKLFGVSWREANKVDPIKVESASGLSVEIGLASPVFNAIYEYATPRTVTMKVSGVQAKKHDSVLDLIQKVSGSLLFQIELITGMALIVKRQRTRHHKREDRQATIPLDVKFPDREFDHAPLSLYWYARSASGMPLLQYLAYYQVVEFYYPIYSQSEAHRRLKSILKNPTFRAEKDSDISRLLSAIQVSRSGAFGDERTQLKATIDECLDDGDLRSFLSENEERTSFLSSKSKLVNSKLSISSVDSELKGEVARRIYELRCKIVHTKSDSRDSDIELLLPFSKEADLMQHDIELIKYVAQQVLIAGSRKLHL